MPLTGYKGRTYQRRVHQRSKVMEPRSGYR